MRRYAPPYSNTCGLIESDLGEYVKLKDVKRLLRTVKEHLEGDLLDYEEEKLMEKINKILTMELI